MTLKTTGAPALGPALSSGKHGGWTAVDRLWVSSSLLMLISTRGNEGRRGSQLGNQTLVAGMSGDG